MASDGQEQSLDRFANSMKAEATECAREIIQMALEDDDVGRRAAATANIVATKWHLGWTLFDASIFAGQQNGLLLLKRADEVRDGHSSIRDALCLLHCAGVLILQEIRTLLAGGLWAGAAARWRALHEVAVSATIIAHEEARIAQRYLDHAFVVQTRRLQEFYDAHGRGPVSADELTERAARSAQLEASYAEPTLAAFREAYGWAAPLMPWTRAGDKRQRPTFEALEKLSGLQHLRLLVFSVHGLVHSDSAGVVTKVLGKPGEWILGPQPDHVETVARPALMSFSKLTTAVQGGFERVLNMHSKVFILQGLALALIAQWGSAEFLEPGSSPAAGLVTPMQRDQQ